MPRHNHTKTRIGVNTFRYGDMWNKVSNAWAADSDIRRQSSSGGVTSALAIYLLESHKVDGVLHVGVQENTYLYNKLLRVVINVLTNLKRFHRPVSSSLSI